MFLFFHTCNADFYFFCCSGCIVHTYEIPRALHTEDDIGMIMLTKVKDEYPNSDFQ